MWDDVTGASRMVNGWLAISVEQWKAKRRAQGGPSDPDPDRDRLIRACERIGRAAIMTRAFGTYLALRGAAPSTAAMDHAVAEQARDLSRLWEEVERVMSGGPAGSSSDVRSQVRRLIERLLSGPGRSAGRPAPELAVADAALDGLIAYLKIAIVDLSQPWASPAAG